MSATRTNRHGSAVVTLPADDEILITRDFDFPAALIFKAWTTPELVKRWWGFDTGEWQVCDVDLRVGGQWRWVVIDRGMEVAFHGTYLEIDAPHRLVSTEVFEGAPGGDENGTHNTMTLVERDGVTTHTTLVKCPSPEVRDAIIESGMEGGMQVSMDRLEEVVRSLS